MRNTKLARSEEINLVVEAADPENDKRKIMTAC